MFRQATEQWPYKYQLRMAQMAAMPPVVRVETGLGKTAAVVLAWVWHRRFANPNVRAQTPRRLVYCLPQRSLVTQTAGAIRQWLTNVGLFDARGDDKVGGTGSSESHPDIHVRVLMGGDLDGDWDSYPEDDQIIVGTQDQLLSRALNRGYAMSRYRWPMHYAWLNNDVQWVVDECQLMEAGLATTAQLQAFRDCLGTRGPTRTTWMSATLNPSWLQTVDYADTVADLGVFSLDPEERAQESIAKRLQARKEVVWADWKLNAEMDKDLDFYADRMVAEIQRYHIPGTLSLVVVNRVARAQAIFDRLRGQPGAPVSGDQILVHSRFRAGERRRIQDRIDLVKDGTRNSIIIATQAVEAGVDLSARTLITELAPWSSLVQRFGRCNRKGEAPADGPDAAKIVIVDMESRTDVEDVARPYSSESVNAARTIVLKLSDAAPAFLPQVDQEYEWGAVLRRRELLDWFDTTSDLSGYDVDVSSYVRGSPDTDVLVLWRAAQEKGPPDYRIIDAELCRVSISQFNEFLKKKVGKGERDCWSWNPLAGKWERLTASSRPRPGEMYCLNAAQGGYDPLLGFSPNSVSQVESIHVTKEQRLETIESDSDSVQGAFLSLADHTERVWEEMQFLVQSFDGGDTRRILGTSAVWHDVGKAHAVFQDKLLGEHANGPERRQTIWAKSPSVRSEKAVGASDVPAREEPPGEEDGMDMPEDAALADRGPDGLSQSSRTGVRDEAPEMTENTPQDPPGNEQASLKQRSRYFRHELASAIAFLEHHARGKALTADEVREISLVAYIIAAHHGKVRVSIRSLPREPRQPEGRLYARGVWDGDTLPELTLGGLLALGPTRLGMDWMTMGSDDATGRGSWVERMLGLLDAYGPFRLAWMESMLRVADWRGSRKGGNPA